jgi:hypothetical protein
MKFANPAAYNHDTYQVDCDPECAWLLEKDGNLFCSVAWFCRKQTRGGRGKGFRVKDEPDFAPWIVNTANGGDSE